MANIPPQENWFTYAQRTVSASSGVILGNLDYTCPRNRCAVITSWWYDEGSDGATLVACFSGAGAYEAPGALPYNTIIQTTADDSVYYPGRRALDVLLGPKDRFFIGCSSGMGTWAAGFSVREIGPCNNNMGSWTE